MYLFNGFSGGLDSGDHGALPEVLGRDEHENSCYCNGGGDDDGPDVTPNVRPTENVPGQTFMKNKSTNVIDVLPPAEVLQVS